MHVHVVWLAQGSKGTQDTHKLEPEEHPSSVFLHLCSQHLLPPRVCLIHQGRWASTVSPGKAHHCCYHSAVVVDSFHCGLQFLSTSSPRNSPLLPPLWDGSKGGHSEASRSKAIPNATLTGWGGSSLPQVVRLECFLSGPGSREAMGCRGKTMDFGPR